MPYVSVCNIRNLATVAVYCHSFKNSMSPQRNLQSLASKDYRAIWAPSVLTYKTASWCCWFRVGSYESFSCAWKLVLALERADWRVGLWFSLYHLPPMRDTSGEVRQSCCKKSELPSKKITCYPWPCTTHLFLQSQALDALAQPPQQAWKAPSSLCPLHRTDLSLLSTWMEGTALQWLLLALAEPQALALMLQLTVELVLVVVAQMLEEWSLWWHLLLCILFRK